MYCTVFEISFISLRSGGSFTERDKESLRNIIFFRLILYIILSHHSGILDCNAAFRNLLISCAPKNSLEKWIVSPFWFVLNKKRKRLKGQIKDRGGRISLDDVLNLLGLGLWIDLTPRTIVCVEIYLNIGKWGVGEKEKRRRLVKIWKRQLWTKYYPSSHNTKS